MVDIRPNQLPDAILPLREADELVVDQGADGVRKAPPIEAVNSVAPVATQAEAVAGSDNVKRMTSLRTKQSIASEVGVTLASNSQGGKADSAVQTVNGKSGNSVTLVKGDVGLGNVDNTSDLNKPISTATQTALDGKASSAQGAKADSAVQSVNGKTGNTITITKADVGLGNVDNTSDADKPISTATQTALNAKANSSVTVSAGAGLTGGGNLTANRTVSLNAASIASLAKADSAVQTVNGIAPTGGNVTVAAEEKRLQDTRTTAIAESFPSNVQFVETAGYSSVGDGGGALYKRVSSPTILGNNIITNGGFSTDTSWIKGTGWTISGGAANKAVTGAHSELGQNTSLIAGDIYAVTYTISNYSGSGWVRPYFGYSGVTLGSERTANGTYTDYLIPTAGAGRVVLQAQATVACSIDNVSVRPVIGAFRSADGAWWEIVLDDDLDIRQFGGRLNDDAFDNGPILEQVLKLGTVKIPGNSTLSCLSSVNISNTNVCIVGKSQSTSHLQFIGATDGFVGTHSLPASGKPLPIFILDNLALVTTNDPAVTQNTAINVTYPEGFFAARFMMYGSAHRCAFRGLNTELNGWGTILRADNLLNFNFIDCAFNGKDEGGAADQTPAKKKRSLYGIYISGGWVPCEVHLTNCQFYHFNECVFTTGSYEGLYVTDCAMVSVGTGIRQIATTFSPNWPGGGGVPTSAVGRPWLTVKGCHFNVYDKGIHSLGVVQASAIGNSFYQSDHAVDDAVLINVESGHDWEVAGNVFRSYSTVAEAIGVVVGNLAGYVDIHDNNFETKNIGIWLKTGGTGNNRSRNNTFKGSYSFASIYEEVPNLISHGARSISLYRTASYAVANGGANVPWDAIGHNDFASFTVGQSGVVIAPGSGIKRVCVTGGCVFDANSTGVRQLQIRKNGNQSYVGAAMTPLVSGGAGSCPLNVFSGVLSVNEGDTLSLFAYQNSGANLNTQGSGLTWFNIEVVE